MNWPKRRLGARFRQIRPICHFAHFTPKVFSVRPRIPSARIDPLVVNRLYFFKGAPAIKLKTLGALTLLLICFTILAIYTSLMMKSAGTQLATVSDKTLPKQTLVMSIANDIVATHMKVFRYVTLASNGVGRKLLDSLYSEVFVELTAEGDGLKILSDHPDLLASEKQKLALILASWPDYFRGVKDVMDVGRTDAAMAVMLLGATDDDFQRIAGQLNAIARQVNRQTASVVSDILINIDANGGWLEFGEIIGILTSILIAIIFARRHIETIALQEKVNEQNIILVEQNKKLEQAAKEKSEFLSNMSHELRTPMHAILGYSKRGFTTIGDRDSAKLEKYFKNIYTSGNRLLGLLNNLLDLSKLEFW